MRSMNNALIRLTRRTRPQHVILAVALLGAALTVVEADGAQGDVPVTPAVSTFASVCPVAGQPWSLTTPTGDGGPALNGSLVQPMAATATAAGDVFVVDARRNTVRRIDHSSGTITTVAGGGAANPGDGGPATAATLSPRSLAVDPAGTALYIGEGLGGFAVRRVDLNTGTITTVAGVRGTGRAFGGPLAGPATSTAIGPISALALSGTSLYLGDAYYGNVQLLDLAAGQLNQVAGNESQGSYVQSQPYGTSWPATSLRLAPITGLAFDGAGHLIIADTSVIERLDLAAGTFEHFAYSGIGLTEYPTGQAHLARGSNALSIAWNNGRLYVADASYNIIRSIDATGTFIDTVAGDTTAGFRDGASNGSQLATPTALAAIPGTTSVVVGDTMNNAVRQLNTASTQLTTIAGAGPRVADPAAGVSALAFNFPDLTGVAADAEGNTYVSSKYANRIYRIQADGTISTFAGSGQVRPDYPTSYTDHEPKHPHDFNRVGNLQVVKIAGVEWLYIVDHFDANGGDRIVRIDLDEPASTVDTVTGVEYGAIPVADGLTATDVSYTNGISDYAIDDRNGDLYVAQGYGNTVWKVTAATGVVNRYAGGNGAAGGTIPTDGTPRLTAKFDFVWGLAFGPSHTLYIGNQAYNRQVYAVTTSDTLLRVAGTNNNISSLEGNGGPALDANIAPTDMVVQSDGAILLADSTQVRRVAMTSPTTSGDINIVVSGSVGTVPYQPLNGELPATQAISGNANQLALLPDGSFLMSDSVVNSGDDSVPTVLPTPPTASMVRRVTAGGCANVTVTDPGGQPVVLSQGQPVNARNIDLANVPSTALTDAALQTFLQSTPLRTSGPGSTPLRTSRLMDLPLRTSGVPPILLSTVPLTNGQRWEDLLGGTSLEGVPIQNITLAQALTVAGTTSLASITLGDIDISASPLRTSSVAAIALGNTTLNQIPGHDPAEADPYSTTWCPWISSVGLSCANFSGSSTVLEVELAAAPLRTSPLRTSPLRTSPLRTSDLSASPLRTSPLRTSDLSASPLRTSPLRTSVLAAASLASIHLTDVPLRTSDLSASPLRTSPLRTSSAPGTLVDCGRVDCSATSTQTIGDAASLVPTAILPTATVGDFFAAFSESATAAFTLGDLKEYGNATIGDIQSAVPSNVTLADVILALIPRSALRWETVPLDNLDLPALGASPPTSRVIGFDLAANRVATDTRIVVTLPPEASYVAGNSALASVASGALPNVSFPAGSIEPQVQGKVLTYTVPASVPGGRRYQLTLDMTAPRTPTTPVRAVALGTIAGDLGLSRADTVINVVDEVAAPPTPERTLNDGDLLVGSISSSTDLDTFVVPVPPVPGATTEVTVSHLDIDADVVAYQPTIRPPATSRSLRTNGLKTPPIESTDPELASFHQNLDPQVLSDIPLQGNNPNTVMAYSAQRGTSDERIEVVTKAGDQGVYRFQVSGYNGAASNQNYLVTVRQQIPAGAGVCPARTVVTPAAPAAATGTITAATRALFLVDQQRLTETYGAAGTNALITKLNTVAARSEVAGAVIKVDGSAAVRAAYSSWDAAPCDADRANQVVGAIDTLVDQLQSALPGTGAKALTSVTLVGSDQMLPMARVADGTKDSNEFQYAANTQRSDTAGAPVGPSPLSSAQAARSMLTDDAYADWDPYSWRDGVLFVPDIATGRLVEKPSEIGVALDSYVANATSTTRPAAMRGRLDAQTALTAGYDFLKDGSQAVDAQLGTRIASRQTLINDTWTRTDLSSKLYGGTTSPDVASINAHFDHYESLPAAGNTSGDTSDLFTTKDVYNQAGRLRGRIIFSMGCHSGLSVPDGYLTGSSVDADLIADPNPIPGETAAQTAKRQRLLDWAEAFANDGAIYVGNTGFGYGDTNSVAFSERLMAQFAGSLDGTVSVGQALVKAKNDYYRGAQLAFSDYDGKAMQEAVFYGLPFWGVGAAATPPAAPTPVATPADPTTAGLAASTVTVNPTFATTTAPGGEVTTTDGRSPLVVDGQPIVARTDVDVTPADGTVEAHGFLITGLTSTDQTGTNVAFGKPVIDLSTNEPAKETNGVVFPSALQGTAVIPSNQGKRQYVNLATTQFIDDPNNSNAGIGTVRRFTSISGRALYAPSTDTDGIAPTIATTTATTNGSGVQFSVDAFDLRPGAGGTTSPGSIVRVLVLYRDGATWRSLDLGRSASTPTLDTWRGSAATTSTQIDYFVQVVDASGNVSVASNKASLYRSTATPQNLSPSVSVGANRTVPTGPVTIAGSFTDADGPTPATGRIDVGDGTGFQPLTLAAATGGGTFSTTRTLTAVGSQVVTVEICDGLANCGRSSVTLTVVASPNVAPTVNAGTGNAGLTGKAITLSMRYTDPDGPTPAVVSVDAGAGAGFQTVSPTPAAGTNFTRTFTYSTPGQYTVKLRVCDGALACSTDTATIVVVSATSTAASLTPHLDCIKVTGSTMVTKWGYDNTGPSVVTFPVGLGNFFAPTPIGRGQPTTFARGSVHNAFTVTTTSAVAVWVLNGRVAVAFRWTTPPAGVATCT